MRLGRGSSSRCHRSSCVDEAAAEEGILGHRSRRQRRLRCEPRGEPRCPVPQRAARAGRPGAEDPRGRHRPPSKRGPLLRRRDAPRLRRAHRPARPLRRRPRIPPEGKRIADGVERVPQCPAHPPRHDDQHRPAHATAVTPRDHGRQRRSLARPRRSLNVTAPETVAHDRNSAAGLPARSPATGAARRAHRRAGRRCLCPKLDVDRGLDDACVASLDRLQLPSAELGGTTVLRTPPANFLSEHQARASSPARPSTTPSAIPARNAQPRRRGISPRPPDLPHAACARSRSRPSAALRANSRAF